MRGHPDQIEQALSDLADAVSQDLVELGWQRRDLNYGVATLTRDIGNGVMATATLARTSFQWPEEWPIEVKVVCGVGYEPALNLMPLLTMNPHVALLDRDHGRDPSHFTVTLGGTAEIGSAARQIVAAITEQAVPYAQQFPDPAAIEAVLSAADHPYLRRPPAEAELDVQESFDDHRTQRRLLLLAVMGRHDQARALLSTYPAQRTDGHMARDDRRFIRQLTRWLDAGGPAAPPVARTLAQLPRDPQRPRPSWADARARSKQKHSAREAVTARIAGESAEAITSLLIAEYARRGLAISPGELAVAGQILHEEHRLRQQPFGRVRSRLAGLRLLTAGAGDVVRAFKSDDTPPPWLRPPERAGYRMTRGNNPATVVTLDPSAQDWLNGVWTDLPRRVGLIAGVDIWLSAEDSAELVAHIGDRRVGTVSDASAFTRELHAAAMFDEDPVTRGMLIRVQEAGPLILELPTPA